MKGSIASIIAFAAVAAVAFGPADDTTAGSSLVARHGGGSNDDDDGNQSSSNGGNNNGGDPDHTHEDDGSKPGSIDGHEGPDHSTSSDDDDHKHHDAHNAGGDGGDHTHDREHSGFNYTDTEQVWDDCLAGCCIQYQKFFSVPVANPLCNNSDYYANVTACVASNCTEHEQGRYAVLTEIECPGEEEFAASAVRSDVEGEGGSPLECEETNATHIECRGEGDAEGESAAAGLGKALGGSVWVGTAGLVAVMFAVMT